ncbi:MAG: RNA modification enzyme, MiaB family [Parcubacteria group bacterium GW2011_GWE2_38_18]|nr:MAG: RNA modification enzyme, MiaB family [Parcubacteria group bacterium GW2011_GWE2_38_18]
MKKITYKIYTLGCKVNQYDSESLSRKLISAGFVVAENNADLAIVNTCTVTHSAIAKDKKMIERAKTDNPNAKIVVVGCMPVNYKKEVEELGVDYIFGTKDADKLIEEIQNSKFKIEKVGSEELNSCENSNNLYKTGKSRYFLKIQDGCQQFCSYCIIPYNRGKLTSRPVEEVLAEVKKIVEAGFKEIILCGIHLGLYGVDLFSQAPLTKGRRGDSRSGDLKGGESGNSGMQIPPTPFVKGGVNLVGLLKELIKIEGLEKIRLSSIEVTEVNDELIELIKTNRKICRHLHIPLQSGCDKILKLMNRPYTTEFFAERIEKLRTAVPEIAITNDVIVGFPGETEEDFNITFDFIKKINFSKLHVFPFSAHEKTPAFSMPDQLPTSIKKQRAKILSEYSLELEEKYKQQFVGQELEVIVDGRSQGKVHSGQPQESIDSFRGQPRESKALFRGKTEYYFDIEFNSDKKLKAGDLVKVKDWKFLE